MAWRFVKQPDGLLARFSDVVENFTAYGMTEQEALDYCHQNHHIAPADALTKVRAGLEDWKPWTIEKPGSGHERWDDSLRIIFAMHGPEELQQVLEQMGFSDHFPAEFKDLGPTCPNCSSHYTKLVDGISGTQYPHGVAQDVDIDIYECKNCGVPFSDI